MNTRPEPKNPRNTLRVVEAIEFLAKNGGGRIDDVAGALGIHKSNASRLLAALRDVEWVTANDSRTWYTLGPRLAAVGHSASGQGIMEIATTMALAIRDETRESVHLSIPDLATASMIVTACFDSPFVLRVSQPVGSRDRLHSTAVGKVFLASLSDTQLESLLLTVVAADAEDRTGMERRLRAEIAAVREQGYAINDQQSREGVVAGAVLISPREREDHPPIALSVTAPASRWSVAIAHEAMRSIVDKYAGEIQRP